MLDVSYPETCRPEILNRMAQFIARMSHDGVAQARDLRGCWPKEIKALEQRYDLRLPQSYALFLDQMGNCAGHLGNDGEFDLLYDDVLHITEEERDSFRQINEKFPMEAAYELPDKAFIFCRRLGNPDYWLIICDSEDDSAVYHFDCEHKTIRLQKTHDSLFDFLEQLSDDAANRVKSFPRCLETKQTRKKSFRLSERAVAVVLVTLLISFLLLPQGCQKSIKNGMDEIHKALFVVRGR
jgi:hypothetical protein